MFISSYTTTSFYEKKFIYLFFRMFIFQWIQYSNVFICNFSLRMGPSIKYVHNWQLMEDIAGGVGWGGGGGGAFRVIQNADNCAWREGMSRLICTYALTLSLFMFLAAFLSYSVLSYL